MTDMIVVYTTCESVKKAKEIGKVALEQHLAACINIYPQMFSMSLWPPKTNKIESGNEVVLLLKTLEHRYKALETLVRTMHSYECPCIFAFPVTRVTKKYYDWIAEEVK